MIAADAFIAGIASRGVRLVSGVPCSFLTPLINRTIGSSQLRYVGATSEGEAVAISVGSALTGTRSAVMFQNSGLGNAVNPLSSLCTPFRIPSLIVTTWRGQPSFPDEPQHELMGRITPSLLDLLNIAHAPFPDNIDEIDLRLDQAFAHMDATGLPFALVMREGNVATETMHDVPAFVHPSGVGEFFGLGGELPSRAAVLKTFLALEQEAAVIASTGKCGRELFTLSDRDQHLYQVGSMGCASAIGLGIALSSSVRVVVLDGDGAALMKLGNWATIGSYRPRNLIHIVLDNGVHDSTGGQPTVSSTVRFPDVALACGYAWAARCEGLAGFAAAYQYAVGTDGPALIHVRIRPGSLSALGRPTLPPAAVADRFRSFLAKHRAGAVEQNSA